MKRHPRDRRGRSGRGFTLLELLVAMSVLMVGVMVGILPLQIIATSMRNYSFQRFNAAVIAKQFLDNFTLYYQGTTWSTIAAASPGYKFSTDFADSKAACPSNFPSVCPTRPAKDGTANRVFCRNGVVYYLNWKSEVASLSGISNLHSARVYAQVAWQPSSALRNFNKTTAPCYYYEISALKYCNMGDSPWGCP